MTKLGQYIDVKSGFAFKSSKFGDNGDLPIARIRDVIRGFSKTFYSGEYLHDFVIKNGDLLVGMDGEFNREYWNGGTALLNQRVCKLSPDLSTLDLSYLYHFIKPELKKIEEITPFVTVKHLSVKKIENINITLPPLAEQKRIAGILDAAEELRQKRQRSLELLDELKQAIFVDMFGDPISNNKAWPLEKLKNLTSKIGSGATPRGGNKSYKDEGIPLIRSMNVRDGLFTSKGLAFIDGEQAKALNNVQVMASDILLNITGASVARVCITPVDYHGARVNQHVAIIRPTSHLNCLFLQFQLLNPSFKSKLLSGAGSGATREAITKSDIENTKIIYPPIEAQNKFEQRITKIFKLESDYFLSFKKFDELFTSLQHKAFAGELSGTAA